MKYGQLSCIEFYSCYLQQCISIVFYYIGSAAAAREPFELGLTVLPSGFLLGIGLPVLSGTQHGVRDPCVVCCMCNQSVFFKNNIFASKMGKKNQRWAENKVFRIYWEI